MTFLHQRQCLHHHIPLSYCVLHTGSTVSSGLTFLYQRQCPHHHIPLFYCVHCILHPLRQLCTVSTVWLHPLNPLVWPFCIRDNVLTTIYHYSTASTAYCIHWFNLFAKKNNVPTTIYHYSTVYCILHPLRPLVWPLCIKDNVPTTIYHYSTVSTAYCILCVLCPLCDCIHWIHWLDLFAPKTMSPPPYITIPLYLLHTASTGLTFLHQRTRSLPPYTTILLRTAYCVLWFDLFVSKTMSPPPYTTILLCPLCTVSTVWLHPLNPLVWPFSTKDNVPTTIYHYSTVSTVYCVHCVLCPLCDCIHWIHWFDLFAPKTMSPPLYTTILLWTAYCVYCILWFDLFVSKTMSPPPYTSILLCTLHTASTPSSHFCVILTQPAIYGYLIHNTWSHLKGYRIHKKLFPKKNK